MEVIEVKHTLIFLAVLLLLLEGVLVDLSFGALRYHAKYEARYVEPVGAPDEVPTTKPRRLKQCCYGCRCAEGRQILLLKSELKPAIKRPA